MRQLNSSSRQAGFTLFELLIGLVMLILFLVATRGVMTVPQDSRKLIENKQRVAEAKSALRIYLQVNGYLPCPAKISFQTGQAVSDGVESRRLSGGVSVCRYDKGVLPFKSLQIQGKDAWHQFFYYQINPRAKNASRINNGCETASVFAASGEGKYPASFAKCALNQEYYCQDCSDACGSPCVFDNNAEVQRSRPPYFSIFTPPLGAFENDDRPDGDKNLVIKSNAMETVTDDKVVDELVVAIVVSFGQNGHLNWQTNTLCSEELTDIEQENCDGDRWFSVGEGVVEEDVLAWITLYEAKAAVLKAGLF